MSSTNLKVGRQFVKDVSFELFMGSKIFSQPWQPDVSVDLSTNHQENDGGEYEVDLHITVNVKLGDQPAFLVEVVQSGLFYIDGLQGDTLEQALGISCPTFLFPYAREAVDSVCTRAGMIPIGLQPINFEELYQSAVAA